MNPSAPAAMAARASGTTRWRRPDEWEGSMSTGRWAMVLTTGAAEMSRVLRVLVSKVRIPRSTSTTWWLPSL